MKLAEIFMSDPLGDGAPKKEEEKVPLRKLVRSKMFKSLAKAISQTRNNPAKDNTPDVKGDGENESDVPSQYPTKDLM